MTREETIQELGEWLEQMIQHGVPSHSAKRKALATAIALLSAESEQTVCCGEWQHKPSISGEWVWWQCSECGAVIYSESEIDRKIHHAYCGVCGTRMKGGDE